MHVMSLSWLSELNFITDEHYFFNDLITSYTHELIDSKSFSKNKNLIDKLSKVLKNNESLIEEIRIHENNLKIMVDGIDQLDEEKKYKENHRKLDQQLGEHLANYKNIKSELFQQMKHILKKKKQRKQLKQ